MKGTISYKIFIFLNCLVAAKKLVFGQKRGFWPPPEKKKFIAYNALLTPRKVYKNKNCKKKFFFMLFR